MSESTRALRPGPGTPLAWAWCYQCRCLQPFKHPLPPIRITMREGFCRVCDAPISRVGGGRDE
jgi:hypothetical protein